MAVVIKVCADPHCEAVWHNCPKEHTKCKDCGGKLIAINEKTYGQKFVGWFFQYDFDTHEYYYPGIKTSQISLDL
jgi:hypothetical protein